MSAVLGTFADARAVKSRSVFQLVIEVPIEKTDEALKALGGWPQPATERWVGVALAPKDRKPPTFEERLIAENKRLEGRDETRKRAWDELSPTEQAGIRSSEPEFGQFLFGESALWHDQHHFRVSVAGRIREQCFVKSRAEFNTDKAAGVRWKQLEAQYQQWLTDRRYESSRMR